MAEDKNGLQLSNQTNSGYKFVTTFFDGPNVGKFAAFAELTNDRMRELGRIYGKNFPGIADFQIITLGIYDDVRDAAHVGQRFYGKGTVDRNNNLQNLFDNRKGVISIPPLEWKHEPDLERMEAAKKRSEGTAINRAGKLDIQDAIGKFYSEHRSEYKISANDAPDIRKVMAEFLEALDRPTSNTDLLMAAEEAFLPYYRK